jgi:hypothetical protein
LASNQDLKKATYYKKGKVIPQDYELVIQALEIFQEPQWLKKAVAIEAIEAAWEIDGKKVSKTKRTKILNAAKTTVTGWFNHTKAIREAEITIPVDPCQQDQSEHFPLREARLARELQSTKDRIQALEKLVLGGVAPPSSSNPTIRSPGLVTNPPRSIIRSPSRPHTPPRLPDDHIITSQEQSRGRATSPYAPRSPIAVSQKDRSRWNQDRLRAVERANSPPPVAHTQRHPPMLDHPRGESRDQGRFSQYRERAPQSHRKHELGGFVTHSFGRRR